jgi:hypothetical protein
MTNCQPDRSNDLIRRDGRTATSHTGSRTIFCATGAQRTLGVTSACAHSSSPGSFAPPARKSIWRPATFAMGVRGTPFHHKGIPGNTGVYSTTVPYDMVFGNGSVDGRQFLGATGLTAPGIPHTATTPKVTEPAG